MKKDLSAYPGVVVDTGVWIEYFLETTLGRKFKEKIVESRISIYISETVVGNYRGNWSPYIPRNLILRYTAPGEFMLNPASGGASAGVWGRTPASVC